MGVNERRKRPASFGIVSAASLDAATFSCMRPEHYSVKTMIGRYDALATAEASTTGRSAAEASISCVTQLAGTAR